MNTREDYHVHCNYNDHSDPDLTVQNAIRQAKKIGLHVLAFTEHVRKTSEWIPDYLNEIESAINNGNNNMKIIAGFEAKILQDGSIDCPDKYAGRCFLIASFHTQFNDKQVWIQALKKAIQNPDVDVIGHIAPEPSFVLASDEISELSHLITANKKMVELNAKYRRPPKEWIRILKKNGVQFHLGSDAHSLREIGRFEKISDLISLVEEAYDK